MSDQTAEEEMATIYAIMRRRQEKWQAQQQEIERERQKKHARITRNGTTDN